MKRQEIENEKWKWKKISRISRETRISLVSARNLIVALVVSCVLWRLVVLACLRWSLVYKSNAIKSVHCAGCQCHKQENVTTQGWKAYLGKLLSGNASRHVGKMTIAVVCTKTYGACNQLKVRLPWYSLCTKPDDIKSLLSSFQFESLDFFPFWMFYSIWTYRV